MRVGGLQGPESDKEDESGVPGECHSEQAELYEAGRIPRLGCRARGI